MSEPTGIDKECCGCGLTIHTDLFYCPDCGCELEPMTTDNEALKAELADLKIAKGRDADLAISLAAKLAFSNKVHADQLKSVNSEINNYTECLAQSRAELAKLRESTRRHEPGEIPPMDKKANEFSIDVLCEYDDSQYPFGISFYDCMFEEWHSRAPIGWYYLPGTQQSGEATK